MDVWFTARGAGLSALMLLTATVALGALASRQGRAATRYVLQYVHRVCAALGLGVLVLHIGTVLADSYAHVGVTGAVVPFTAGYRATAVGLGTIAAYLLLVVAATGFARGRIAATALGARVWRRVHVAGYAAWALALTHGWFSGTDTSTGWVRVLYLGCATAGVASIATRTAAPTGRPAPLLTGAMR